MSRLDRLNTPNVDIPRTVEGGPDGRDRRGGGNVREAGSFPARVGANTEAADHRPTLFLCDPRPWTRVLSGHFLQNSLPNVSVRAVRTPGEAASMLSDGLVPAFLVLNIGAHRLTDRCVLQWLECARDSFPDTPVVILCDEEHPDDLMTAVERGIQGYLPATTEPSVVVAAFHLIECGGAFIPVALLQQALAAERPAQLAGLPSSGHGSVDFPPRQKDVLQLLCQGFSNKIIAYRLHMKESTVKVHVRQIMRKLQATNRTEAALRGAALLSRDV